MARSIDTTVVMGANSESKVIFGLDFSCYFEVFCVVSVGEGYSLIWDDGW